MINGFIDKVPVFENQRPGEALFEVSLTNPSLVVTFTEVLCSCDNHLTHCFSVL